MSDLTIDHFTYLPPSKIFVEGVGVFETDDPKLLDLYPVRCSSLRELLDLVRSHDDSPHKESPTERAIREEGEEMRKKILSMPHEEIISRYQDKVGGSAGVLYKLLPQLLYVEVEHMWAELGDKPPSLEVFFRHQDTKGQRPTHRALCGLLGCAPKDSLALLKRDKGVAWVATKLVELSGSHILEKLIR